jgi:hypothetical protein
MNQNPNAKAYFTVTSGEQVRVTVGAVKCNCLTSAAYNGTAIPATSKNPDIYDFTVTGRSQDQTVFACVCTFQTSDPSAAYYTIAARGSNGGDFTVPPVYKEAPEAAFQLYFTIT